jgi:hypothetical protein
MIETITGSMLHKNNQLIAMVRILKWCHSHVTLTEKESAICNYHWKNCAEWVTANRWGKKYETQKDCKIPKNLFIMVEMIANKLDRKHAAESLGRYVKSKILLINFTLISHMILIMLFSSGNVTMVFF